MNRQGWRLEARIAWRLALVMLTALGAVALVIIWQAVATARSMDDAALEVEARTLAGYLRAGPDGAPVLNLPLSLAASFRRSDDDSLFLVTDAANQLQLSSKPRTASLITPFLPSRPGLFRTPPDPRHPHGMVGAMVHAGPWRLAVAYGREQGEALANSMLPDLLTSSLTALVPISLVTVLIGFATVRFGLRPLREVSAAAAAISPTQPGARLSPARLPAEVQPLVEAMNAALARLETALAAQRRFVGEAAHTLRTPLAVLTARLDALPDLPAAAALSQDVTRMSRLVDQMLKLARIESVPLDTAQPVQLRQVAVEAISLLAPLAVRREVELVLAETVPSQDLVGNHAILVIALINLVENALLHAPAHSAVEVLIDRPYRIAVLDRGPGVPPQEQEQIFARFARGTGAQHAGAGLGLAIVAEIAAAHHGRVWLEPRPGGGAAFYLELPPPVS